MGDIETEIFEKVFNKFTKSKKISEGILLIENTNGDFSFSKAYGGKELTVSDLLFQSSGLPDIFSEGKDNIKNQIIQEDYYITFSDMNK